MVREGHQFAVPVRLHQEATIATVHVLAQESETRAFRPLGRGSSQKGWGWAIGHVTLATTINNLSEHLDVSLTSIAFNWISRLCWACLQVYARLHTAFLNASAPCRKVCSWIPILLKIL